MSCYTQSTPSFAASSSNSACRPDQSAFTRTIVAIIDAFQEALAMRRAAYRRYRLSDD